MTELQDFVAQLPEPIIQIKRLGGQDGLDFTVQKGFIAEIPGKEYFIHCRAMLPLKDFKSGVGFGLWVAISKPDFDRYLRATDDDELYRQFAAVGSLANDWPGFPGTLADRVRVRTVHLSEKVYITEYLSEPKDVLMRVSLLAQPDNFETKERIRDQAMSYLIELNQFAQSHHEPNFSSTETN
ncbi:MAG: DUF2199 domain-containing protein [Patescibacteria group bacterium]